MFYMNRRFADQRDQIVFGEDYNSEKYSGGIRRFDYLSSEDLNRLLDIGLADPDEQQNEAPTTKEISKFLNDHQNFWAHGYVVSPERDDYRVSLEGVECGSDYDLSDVQDFFSLFKYPDEVSVEKTGMYCWFD